MNIFAPFDADVAQPNMSRPAATPQRRDTPPVGAPLDPGQAGPFQRFFQKHVSNVAIVTAIDGIRSGGVAVTSVCALMPAPPSLIVSIERDTNVARMIERSRRFGVNLLGEGQRDVADAFRRAAAAGGEAPLAVDSGAWFVGPAGIPLLADCVGRTVCDVFQSHTFATHVMLIGIMGDVETETKPAGEGQPLLYGLERFCRILP